MGLKKFDIIFLMESKCCFIIVVIKINKPALNAIFLSKFVNSYWERNGLKRHIKNKHIYIRA